ncbi:hypothetical protein GF402_02005 [Candidatus Fermentibacteria bacterium]|nr:hypothetical protein [Candidatus Fermentibacteria bacterium]
MRLTVLLLLTVAVCAFAYDPLYYQNLTEVLPSMGTSGNIALGYFHTSQIWLADSTGEFNLYDLQESNSVLRMLFTGRYGLTASHTLSGMVPMYIQLAGEESSGGGGIADPWISVDGWIERDPQVLLRGALRIPLKGYLETGDYTESDPHMALDGAVTVKAAVSSGVFLQGTGGLRYYMEAWDRIPGSPDSAETKPPVELRGTGFLVFLLNPELEARAGLEVASRGKVSAEIGGSSQEVPHSSYRVLDLRLGFDLGRTDMDLTADVYIRLSGENAYKEWGVMLTGLGLGFSDLVETTGGGR